MSQTWSASPYSTGSAPIGHMTASSRASLLAVGYAVVAETGEELVGDGGQGPQAEDFHCGDFGFEDLPDRGGEFHGQQGVRAELIQAARSVDVFGGGLQNLREQAGQCVLHDGR